MIRSLPLLLLAACTGDEPGDSDKTPADSDSADTDPGPCTTQVLSFEPANGTTEVYYQSTLVVSFDGDGGSAVFTLTDEAGADVPVSAVFTDGNVQAELTATLGPLTTYTLTVDLCGATTTSSFTTSELGSELTLDPADLVGMTYVFRISDAEITEPAFLDVLAATYLTVPILISVADANETSIDLFGGLGCETGDIDCPTGDSEYVQYDLPSWDFPVADFTTQPYFLTESPLVTIQYGDLPIPIENFTLAGTFAADGSAIEEGYATGIGDTRYMGELVGKPDEPGAVCDLASSAGVYCTDCSDGEPYCMYIVAEHITASLVDGLTMVEIAE